MSGKTFPQVSALGYIGVVRPCSPNFGTLPLISVTFGLTVTVMPLMTDTKHIAEAVKARLKDLGKWGDLTAIAAASGVSDNTWRPLLKTGIAPRREGRRVAIAEYLEWDPDALTMLEAGADPAIIPTRRYAKPEDQEPPPGHSAWNPRDPTDPPPTEEERIATELSDVVSFLSPEEKAQLAAIAQTFLDRRRASEEGPDP